MKTGTLYLNEKANVSLTCYLHEGSAELANIGRRPAVLVLPGGGYRACSDREAEPVALAYLAEGYQAFVLRYSLNDNAKFPAPLRDAERALETIRQHAGEWNVDEAKIAAIGFSAGGHLAAMLGATGRVRPAALILGYPCILAEMGQNGVLPHPVPPADEAVDADTPPTFLFATRDDNLVPVANSLRFADALEKAGIPFELHVLAHGAHGLSLAKPLTSSGSREMVNPSVARWFGMSVDWLHQLWGDYPADRAQTYSGVATEYTVYSADVALRELWANPACQALLLEALPALADEKAREMAMRVSLRMMAGYAPDTLPAETLAVLDEKLRAIPVQ